jgi:L-amino acid N-acyltransferase YncA
MTDYSWLAEAPGLQEWVEQHKADAPPPLRLEVAKFGEDRWHASVVEIEGAEGYRATIQDSIITAAAQALQALGRQMMNGAPEAIDRGLRLFDIVEPKPDPETKP